MTFEEQKECIKFFKDLSDYYHKRLENVKKSYNDLEKEFDAYKKKVEEYNKTKEESD